MNEVISILAMWKKLSPEDRAKALVELRKMQASESAGAQNAAQKG